MQTPCLHESSDIIEPAAVAFRGAGHPGWAHRLRAPLRQKTAITIAITLLALPIHFRVVATRARRP